MTVPGSCMISPTGWKLRWKPCVLESLDTGKPIEAAREEMGACVDIFRYMAGAVRCMSGIAAGEYMEGFTR